MRNYVIAAVLIAVIHHPSVALLQILRNNGTDIADDVIAQGAEGINVRWRAREG
jgi:hypothetical protein